MKETNRIKKSFIVQQNAIDDFFVICHGIVEILSAF